MAEFDYEVVNGRKIRVRPVETVSEVDENGYFVRQPNHFTEGFGEGKNPVEAGIAIGTCSHALGTTKALELGEVQGAMSGIAIGVAGMITVLLTMFL